ncbi:hypothetical protein AS189_09315 [Arthrobacter alpinus]|uniref:Serine/threonine-protein kinase HipA n=1 Tax=Arthrobacter alpinus TaxID=656366 RepID=A0A0S2LYV6_9MICC|nr:HipA domain-containing protein [Arthrobacter alpinus]ALO66653.1 hypothetical protein AS189_09315 [Arthrobacter alpinus]
MSTKFEVFLHSRHVGVLSRSDADLSFQYDADVVSEYGVNSPCLSLSLPVSDIPIGGPQVSLYFDKLLPGDIARSKPTIGITGAVQVRPAGEFAEALPESLTLTDQDLAIAIESTVMLRRNGDEWALPGNNLPATHLVKTVRPSDYTGPHLLPSEEWALRVARTAGLRAAEAYIETLAGREALIVTRFDLSPGGEVLHSEDFFQALALDEVDVFEESQAGLPSRLTRLVTIAAPHSIDEEEFKRDLLRAVTFNLLIGNGDAHSKNYSIGTAPGFIDSRGLVFLGGFEAGIHCLKLDRC